MSAPEWTRGPWLAGEGGGRGATTFAYEIGKDGKQQSAIAGCTLEFVERPMKERIANARLIAAAPELYEALANTLAVAKLKWGNLDEDVNVVFAQANAALAKARGDQ